MLVSFISKYLVDEIEKRSNAIKYDEYYFFDEPVIDGTVTFDRINRWSVYQKNKHTPTSFYKMKAYTLMSIYQKVRDKEGRIRKGYMM